MTSYLVRKHRRAMPGEGVGRLHQNKVSSIVRQVDLLTRQQDMKIKTFHPYLLFLIQVSPAYLLLQYRYHFRMAALGQSNF